VVSPVQRIPVPFRGLATDVEELTWGQREIWTAMVSQRSWMPIPLVRTLEPGTTVADVGSELRYCLGRYDSLRTRLTFDAAGEPRQVVAGDGELVLEVFEAGDADPDAVAAQVVDRYRDHDFDFAHDWPVRTAVVLRNGAPSHVVSVFCHLAIDGAARMALLAELADRDRAPFGAMRPTELARWERTEAAIRASATSMRHWEALLREIPARRSARSGDPRSPRYWEAVFESRAMHLALQVISRRTKASTAALLAVFAVALARVTGDRHAVAQVVVSNRFRPHLANVFAPVNQTGLWAVEVGGATFDEVFSQSRRRAVGAYKHAYYDPRQRDELIARVSRERGEEVDVGWFVNDRRLTTGADPADHDPTPARLRAASGETTLAWRTRTDAPSERFFLNVEDVPGLISLTVQIDTHAVAPADLTALLREMEAVAVAAALDPASPPAVAVAR
jgi:hypothetical protein